MKHKRVAAIFLLVVAWTPLSVSAECPPYDVHAAKRDAVLVFEGNITRLQLLANGESAATMDVHRVWKGRASKQTTVYFARQGEGLGLSEGAAVVIFARPQSPKLRQEARLPSDSPQRSLWIPSCSGAMSSTKALIKQLGRFSVPSDR